MGPSGLNLCHYMLIVLIALLKRLLLLFLIHLRLGQLYSLWHNTRDRIWLLLTHHLYVVIRWHFFLEICVVVARVIISEIVVIHIGVRGAIDDVGINGTVGNDLGRTRQVSACLTWHQFELSCINGHFLGVLIFTFRPIIWLFHWLKFCKTLAVSAIETNSFVFFLKKNVVCFLETIITKISNP